MDKKIQILLWLTSIFSIFFVGKFFEDYFNYGSPIEKELLRLDDIYTNSTAIVIYQLKNEKIGICFKDIFNNDITFSLKKHRAIEIANCLDKLLN